MIEYIDVGKSLINLHIAGLLYEVKSSSFDLMHAIVPINYNKHIDVRTYYLLHRIYTSCIHFIRFFLPISNVCIFCHTESHIVIVAREAVFLYIIFIHFHFGEMVLVCCQCRCYGRCRSLRQEENRMSDNNNNNLCYVG